LRKRPGQSGSKFFFIGKKGEEEGTRGDSLTRHGVIERGRDEEEGARLARIIITTTLKFVLPSKKPTD
jgi:hypothetical protein